MRVRSWSLTAMEYERTELEQWCVPRFGTPELVKASESNRC